MTQERKESYRPETWDEFVKERPYFPDLMWKWISLTENLLKSTQQREGDDLGFLICGFTAVSIVDLNDILTLSHSNSRSGAPKILRSVYERTVTMKNLASNPTEVPQFIGYQSVDWEQVIRECEAKSSAKMSEQSRSNLAAAARDARKDYRGEVCPHCKMRKQINWTPRPPRELAEIVKLEHMHFFGYIFPSKTMHTTFYGTMEFMKNTAPLYNILNTAHELLVQSILIHRRHFAKDCVPTPMMRAAVMDFRRAWVYAETSFDGLLHEYRPGVFV